MALATVGIALAATGVLGLSPADGPGGPVRPVVPVPAWETGRVVRVIDGDTYSVLLGGQLVRVRLLGVDAPETGQPFGRQASDSVRARVEGQLVRMQRLGTDLYGRTLGVVRVLPAFGAVPAPAVALDSLLVVRGWAWAWDPNHTVAGRAQQQTQAQQGGRGLWKCGKDAPVPPKLWRGFNAAIKRRYLGGCSW